MKVRVRLFAGLRDRFPPETRGRGEVELPADATLADLLEQLGIEPAQAQMTLVNGVQVPRSPGARERHVLHDGDVVSIFPPVAGG